MHDAHAAPAAPLDLVQEGAERGPRLVDREPVQVELGADAELAPAQAPQQGVGQARPQVDELLAGLQVGRVEAVGEEVTQHLPLVAQALGGHRRWPRRLRDVAVVLQGPDRSDRLTEEPDLLLAGCVPLHALAPPRNASASPVALRPSPAGLGVPWTLWYIMLPCHREGTPHEVA